MLHYFTVPIKSPLHKTLFDTFTTMGTYINIGNAGFKRIRNSEYVDKSMLIAYINSTLFTEQSFSCVTRCRRFGKSMAAKMLCAYYDHSVDSHSLFSDLKISSHPSYENHINKYPVIYLDMTEFVTRFDNDDIVSIIDSEIRSSIIEAYPQVGVAENDDLMGCLIRIAAATGEQFVFIIDEWDAICREFPHESRAMDKYVNWLRRMFKGVNASNVFAGVYMTGILPVKKYKTESALNNFIEYSMVEPGKIAQYFGLTKEEVKTLAERHKMEFYELEKWYDGYQIGEEQSMFNPNSVIQAISRNRCRSYWSGTGAFEGVAKYICMNFDGLKDDILNMLAGGRCKVDPTSFQNDINIINSKNDVFTVLIHLGYLSYNWRNDECYIPNREVWGEMVNAVKSTNWTNIIKTLDKSEQLLKSTLEGDSSAVARSLDMAHDEHTSILAYNDENSLACVISIAYYYARNDYIFHRELPTGKGFADIVLIPRKNIVSPAIVIELKYAKDADSGITQIHRRQYPSKVSEYAKDMLLVAINYDKKLKAHECTIEHWRG